MLSVLIKGTSGDIIVAAEKVVFYDSPLPEGGGFAGGQLAVHWPARDHTEYYNAGTAYVMNDKGKTVATYHMSA